MFYASRLGRPSLRPGRYFRLLFIGYFEGLSSERGFHGLLSWMLRSRRPPKRRVDAGRCGARYSER